MSLVQLANVCSHLQNASLARLGLTSIPHSRLHLLLAVQLQKQGFISNVVLAGSTPPAKLLPQTAVDHELKFQKLQHATPSESIRHAFDTSNPFARQREQSAELRAVRDSVLPPEESSTERLKVQEQSIGEPEDFSINELFPASNLHPETEQQLRAEAFTESEQVTQTNRASRRLWLSLKYWDGEPVMRKLKMLSRPTQKLWLTHDDLSRIVRGKRANYIDGMTRIGECIFLSTDKGIMEARECVERRIGGMALCRIWG
ncbi:ribosomal protein S8 [Myriangium duriaei CBS 260.36]|uniref:Ribosomal protein S8 n=1 Tax=Myriangium duriaei CBS 260.36 TaxID=1168546 RepID=A0A9P4MF36_9PEZI|nr:ribosomal protein S8 [Myriangium duriaei CBS 260.36]